MATKYPITGRDGGGKYVGRYRGHNLWHRIRANSKEEARQKMLKGTRYKRDEVIIKTYKQVAE